jgi:hypothetical protein
MPRKGREPNPSSFHTFPGDRGGESAKAEMGHWLHQAIGGTLDRTHLRTAKCLTLEHGPSHFYFTRHIKHCKKKSIPRIEAHRHSFAIWNFPDTHQFDQLAINFGFFDKQPFSDSGACNVRKTANANSHPTLSSPLLGSRVPIFRSTDPLKLESAAVHRVKVL